MHPFSPESIMQSEAKRDLVEAINKAKAESEANQPAAQLEKKKLFGVKISVDHGESWRNFALCQVCIKSVEPPLRLKNEGEAGALNCDWCGTYNKSFCGFNIDTQVLEKAFYFGDVKESKPSRQRGENAA